MTEEYDMYGEIKPERTLSTHQEHRIHETKDLFEGDCFLCQEAAKKGVKTFWADGE